MISIVLSSPLLKSSISTQLLIVEGLKLIKQCIIDNPDINIINIAYYILQDIRGVKKSSQNKMIFNHI